MFRTTFSKLSFAAALAFTMCFVMRSEVHAGQQTQTPTQQGKNAQQQAPRLAPFQPAVPLSSYHLQ